MKTNGTIGFLVLKNIDLDAKIVIRSDLLQKLWSKPSFCIMVVNVTHSCRGDRGWLQHGVGCNRGCSVKFKHQSALKILL